MTQSPAELLRYVAACRREYIHADSPPHIAEALGQECHMLELAALIVEGDLAPLYGLLPSWKWTKDMLEAIKP